MPCPELLRTKFLVKHSVFWMWCHMDLARTNVSEESSASVIRVTRIEEVGTILFLRGMFRLLVLLPLFLTLGFLSPWWCRQYVPPTHPFVLEPQEVTSLKTEFFTLFSAYVSLSRNRLRSSFRSYLGTGNGRDLSAQCSTAKVEKYFKSKFSSVLILDIPGFPQYLNAVPVIWNWGSGMQFFKGPITYGFNIHRFIKLTKLQTVQTF
jgi:hypothetical protein